MSKIRIDVPADGSSGPERACAALIHGRGRSTPGCPGPVLNGGNHGPFGTREFQSVRTDRGATVRAGVCLSGSRAPPANETQAAAIAAEHAQPGGPPGGPDPGQDAGERAQDQEQDQLQRRRREHAQRGTAGRPHHGPAQERPEDHSARRPEHRDDHRLPADHAAGLRPGLPQRAQQPQLTGPLVDRQRQRVGHAHQRDDDGQRQHHVDQPEDGVHPAGRAGQVLRPVLHARLAGRRDRRGDRGVGGPSRAPGFSLIRTMESSACPACGVQPAAASR